MNAKPMPIIVGSPRSGTTLLRLMLDSHPEVAIPPETGFISEIKKLDGTSKNIREDFYKLVTTFPEESPNWVDYGISKKEFYEELKKINPFSPRQGVLLFYKMYAKKFDKKRFGDKTPLYCKHIEYIGTLLPEARIIHIIRDGRDAAVSLRRFWFSPGEDMRTLAEFWKGNISEAKKQSNNTKHYLEIKYEDLIANTEAELKKICDYLEMDFSEQMLYYYNRSSDRLKEHKGRSKKDGTTIVTKEERYKQQIATTHKIDQNRVYSWEKTLSKKEAEEFEEVAGDILRELGYRTHLKK